MPSAEGCLTQSTAASRSPRVLITDAMLVNGGDEALVTGLIKALTRRWPAARFTILSHRFDESREVLPDLQIARALEREDEIEAVEQYYRSADLIISAPGGFLHEHYDITAALRGFQLASGSREATRSLCAVDRAIQQPRHQRSARRCSPASRPRRGARQPLAPAPDGLRRHRRSRHPYPGRRLPVAPAGTIAVRREVRTSAPRGALFQAMACTAIENGSRRQSRRRGTWSGIFAHRVSRSFCSSRRVRASPATLTTRISPCGSSKACPRRFATAAS